MHLTISSSSGPVDAVSGGHPADEPTRRRSAVVTTHVDVHVELIDGRTAVADVIGALGFGASVPTPARAGETGPNCDFGQGHTVVEPRWAQVLVDGRAVDPDSLASESLYEGAHIHVRAATEVTTQSVSVGHHETATSARALSRSSGGALEQAVPHPAPVFDLVGIDGPHGGHLWRLAPGDHRLSNLGLNGAGVLRVQGRSVSIRSHAEADGAVETLVPVERDLRLGDSRVRIRPTQQPSRAAGVAGGGPSCEETSAQPAGGHIGPIIFNRPPRTLHPHPPVEISCPTRVTVQGTARRVSAVMIVLPLLFGVSMAVFFGRLMFLAFALMGPLMMIGNTIDDRRRRRRERATNETEFQNDVQLFAARLREESESRRKRSLADHPPPGTLISSLDMRATSLWQRRPDHLDFMVVALGNADAQWRDGIRSGGATEPEVADAIERHAVTMDTPIALHLGPRRVAGVYGDRSTALGSVRALLTQVAYWHGPADVRIAIITDRPADWDWTKWLPHVRASDGDARLLGSTDSEISAILSLLRIRPENAERAPLTVLVSDCVLADRDLARLHREALAGAGCPLSAIVLAETVTDLPASCTDVLHTMGSQPSGSSARAHIHYARPASGDPPVGVRPWTVSPIAAVDVARRLACYEDPEALAATGSLPAFTTLSPLLDLPTTPTPDSIVARWTSAQPGSLCAPIGAVAGGALVVDLVRDGPHGLIAGTTGSGKSELLRALVASLAALYPPDLLTFVLVDYKGGSAFDACAGLPHVAGVVTDLDEHLGERALTCLEAELRYRETRLREAGVSDVTEYQRLGSDDPLPRMVIVVDEFAAMAADLPDFMGALVDIAQRGRSLGVHLVLATQRPSGVVKDSIRANTNLRISLRVQTPADSNDVLADPAASRISRDRPGRAILRLGPGELVPFQSALVTGSALAETADARPRVSPFIFSMRDPAATPTPTGGTGTELDTLVRVIGRAADAAGSTPSRSPWPEPLPAALSFGDLGEAGDMPGYVFGLRDEPEQQRQVPHRWDPPVDGNLLLVGAAGSTMALRALAFSMARTHPDELHLYAIDHAAGGLDAIGHLPHVGGVIQAHDRERQERLLRFLSEEIDHRRRGGRNNRRVVFMLDGLGGLRSAFDDVTELDMREMLDQIIEAGPAVNVFTVVTAAHARAIPGTMLAAIRTRVVFRLADRLDYSTLGVTERHATNLPEGRGVDAATGRHLHVAGVDDAAFAAFDPTEPHGCGTRTAHRIEVLPQTVKLSEIIHVADRGPAHLLLPLGIDDRTLTPVTLRLDAGDHALITGTARSGKSSLLASMAMAVAAADPEMERIGLSPRHSPLREMSRGVWRPSTGRPESAGGSAVGPATNGPSYGDETRFERPDGGRRPPQALSRPHPEPPTSGLWIAADLEAFAELVELTAGRPRVVFIDDAEDIEDPDGLLEGLLAARDTGDHVIAAGRSDGLRAAYRHWTKMYRAGRRGVILQPLDSGDAEPLGARLPRRLPTDLPVGRGYLVADGTARLIQAALPTSAHQPAAD